MPVGVGGQADDNPVQSLFDKRGGTTGVKLPLTELFSLKIASSACGTSQNAQKTIRS
jgi:hypothetical protein